MNGEQNGGMADPRTSEEKTKDEEVAQYGGERNRRRFARKLAKKHKKPY